jgi:hypothetical protein
MPWEGATVPDRITSAGNGADSVADTPESRILSEVALFQGLPAEELSKIEARLDVESSPPAHTSSPPRTLARPYTLFWRTA